jgi:ABC-type multidrug transport system ATPase subunit
MNSIETHSLSYSFGRKKVLDQIDPSVPKESVFGFLGPNGSGKTTGFLPTALKPLNIFIAIRLA